MIKVTPEITLQEREIEERFIRASGPGGQNVNKVATAVQLRFDVRGSSSLPDAVRTRLERLGGARMTKHGVLVITAQRFRTQERNRQDARDRLIELVRKAAVTPRKRRPTRPTAASKVKRSEAKIHRAKLKSRRTKPARED